MLKDRFVLVESMVVLANSELIDKLGVAVLPSIQFGRLLSALWTAV
jgi:hypothetical protein